MKYDDASWHYGGQFPKDLKNAAGATHIAMFSAWCLLHGLGGALHAEDFADDLERLRSRQTTPGEWFINTCDAKFTDEDLNAEGNAFAAFYYAPEQSPYPTDYETAVAQDLDSIYHVPDSWETYDLLAPVIEQRYGEWKQTLG